MILEQKKAAVKTKGKKSCDESEKQGKRNKMTTRDRLRQLVKKGTGSMKRLKKTFGKK